MVSGLSSTLLQNYSLYVGSSKKVSTEEMFENLSEELGCNGETITKEGLDSFVKAHGKDLSATKLKALETLQTNWGTIAAGKDSISYENMKGYTSFLGLIYTSDRITSPSAAVNPSAAKTKINDILVSFALNGGSKTAESALSSYLKELLADDSEEYDNGDDIDSVVNMLSKISEMRANVIDSSLVHSPVDYSV